MPFALSTLQLVQPLLEKAALVVIDNVEVAKEGYQYLVEYPNITTRRGGLKESGTPLPKGSILGGCCPRFKWRTCAKVCGCLLCPVSNWSIAIVVPGLAVLR